MSGVVIPKLTADATARSTPEAMGDRLRACMAMEFATFAGGATCSVFLDDFAGGQWSNA
ncbi:MAG TPA: hypothetical protein VHC69_30345 [Polyangiaceae bacterium]|nr:hypothetical protein [Polyangiaceae bacterium]